jgi:hypothetical protein
MLSFYHIKVYNLYLNNCPNVKFKSGAYPWKQGSKVTRSILLKYLKLFSLIKGQTYNF